jgi:TfoX/Sxy family transcriptional regulator of competence genes
MPFDADLAERLREAVSAASFEPGETIGETKMFGGLCVTLNGKMLIGVGKTRLMVRLGDEDFERLSLEGSVSPMDFTGRPLRNFAYVEPGYFETKEQLVQWSHLSAKYVREHMFDKPTKKRRSRA